MFNWLEVFINKLSGLLKEAPYLLLIFVSSLLLIVSILQQKYFEIFLRIFLFSVFGVIWRHAIKDLRGRLNESFNSPPEKFTKINLWLTGFYQLVNVIVVIFLVILILPSTYSENKNLDIFSMQQKCSEAGVKLYEKDLESAKLTSLSLGNPEYHYNKELNSCLYFNILIGEGNLQKWIKDSFSNKELVSVIEINGKLLLNKSMCDSCVTNEQFNIMKKSLFSK
jgi:hypothetical protein